MVLNGPGRFDPPLDPDATEARRWVLDELANPEYRAAEPTAFDLFAQAAIEQGANGSVVGDAFVDLFGRAGFRESFDDQRVQFRVLRFFHPVVPQQALK